MYRFHHQFTTLFLAVIVCVVAGNGGAFAGRLPDIVVYLADDLSTGDLSIYGGQSIETPGLDALAAKGMTFNWAFVASPSCAPSRAALLTGLMPARNGAEENHTFPRPDIYRLPNSLNRLGYQTAAFGKVAHGKSAVDYGFETIDLAKDFPQLKRNVKNFLQGRSDPRPLALFVGTSNPHVPWPEKSAVQPSQVKLPTKLIDTPRTRVQRSRYLQEVKELDAYLTELRSLAKQHLSEDSVFIFSSDHGAQFPFGKWTLYDEGIHVPLVVVWPGKTKAGGRTDAMVSWIDLIPTIIDGVGGDVPQGLDGRSFQSVLVGSLQSHREFIFATHSGDRQMNVYPSRSVRTENHKLIFNLHPEFAFTTHIDVLVRETSGDYFEEWRELAKTDQNAATVLERYHGRPMYELYDLKRDPDEQVNINDAEHSGVFGELKGELLRWMTAQDDKRTVFHEPRMLSAPDTWGLRE